MVVHFIFHFHGAGAVFLIAAVFIQCGDELVGVVFIIVYLCRFKPYGVHAYFGGQFFYVFYLVLVGFYHEKLENDKRRFTVQLLFPFDNVFGAGNNLIQLSAHAVLLVYVLRGAVDGNNQPVQPAFHRFLRIGLAEVMGIGGGG